MGRQKTRHIDNPLAVGRRLHHARLKSHLTLRALAFPGCSAAYLSHIERGERTPSLQVLVELAQRLDVDPDYLAWGKNGPSAQLRALPARSPADGQFATWPRDTYRLALHQAKSGGERSWALAGLAQLALVQGNFASARKALEDALAALGSEPGEIEPTDVRPLTDSSCARR